MAINKQSGDMYSFIDKTFNPLAGSCSHSCSYCWLNELKARFPLLKAKYSGEIRLDEKAFKSLGHDKTWFVCSCNDLFAENVPAWMIIRVLEHCEKYDNTYLFQTKNPLRFNEYKSAFPLGTLLCTTVETNRYYPEMGNTLTTIDRIVCLSTTGLPCMVTIEPIMDFDLIDMASMLALTCNLKQVNIGVNTNHKVKLPEPPPEKIRQLIMALKEEDITVYLKPNLKRLLPEME